MLTLDYIIKAVESQKIKESLKGAHGGASPTITPPAHNPCICATGKGLLPTGINNP